MQVVSLRKVSKDSKILLLKEFGYESDGTYVLDSDGNRVIDDYIDEEVTLENMIILPGSTIILDDNPLSITSYLEDHGDCL